MKLRGSQYQMRGQAQCAYCGRQVNKADRDHVIPKCMYPKSKAYSRVQRITVPACKVCNGSWCDDEAHFRNVLLVAGKPNDPVTELWVGPTRRSFEQADGPRRVRDLVEQMILVDAQERHRWIIYPGRDERVMRIIRKIIRGLCHHHGIESAVADERVWADVQKFMIPDELLASMRSKHCEPDIVEYRYEAYADGELASAWYINFFERRPFVGAVYRKA